MKPANFPGRIKLRREQALERLTKGKARPQRKDEEAEAYTKYTDRRNQEIKTLQARVK